MPHSEDRAPDNRPRTPLPKGPENLPAYEEELDARRREAHEADPVQDPNDEDPGQNLRAPEEQGIRQARPEPDEDFEA